MAENSTIEWTDHTWSPWIGCTKVSPACDGCYAEHLMDTRLGRVAWGPHGERSRTSADYWRKPLTWNRQAAAAGRAATVFPSLCDPFDNRADPAVRREWFGLIRATPHLTWLLLTKRPSNIVRLAEAAGGLPPNAAIGATCEDQKRAIQNVPDLLAAKRDTGAAFAFLSCEPLLGPIDLRNTWPDLTASLNALTGEAKHLLGMAERLPPLGWVITGGETDQGAHRARASHPDWYRAIRDACAAAGVPYLHKQNGEWVADDQSNPGAFPNGWRALRAHTDGPAQRDELYPEAGAAFVSRVGKKAAGRLLDGVEHNGMPEVRR